MCRYILFKTSKDLSVSFVAILLFSFHNELKYK